MSKHNHGGQRDLAGMSRYLNPGQRTGLMTDAKVERRLIELGLVGSVRNFIPATDPAPNDIDHQFIRDMGLNKKSRYEVLPGGARHEPFWLLIP